MADDPEGPRPDGDSLLTTREAAELLNVSWTTLRDWRYKKKGPPWYTLGAQRVRYPRGELVQWASENRVFLDPRKR